MNHSVKQEIPNSPTHPATNAVTLITGGTGSLGQKLTEILLKEYNPRTIRIYSRGEFLQSEMAKQFSDDRIRFFIGDVRDRVRLSRALKGVDLVVHAAALKQIVACEYNPTEAISTNILGARNVVECSIENNVPHVFGISSDKAVNPVNLYGATKMVMEHLFTQSNIFGKTRFACSRYGNVVMSRGSVMPLFLEQKKTGTLTITDTRMTRFWLTLDDGVRFVLNCISAMHGGEIFIPMIPSVRVTDIAQTIAPSCPVKVIGIRPGEKLHETLITPDEAHHTRQYEGYFVVQPEFAFWTEDRVWDKTGVALENGYRYSSDNNNQWITEKEILKVIGEAQ